jgi:cysteine desulfurase
MENMCYNNNTKLMKGEIVIIYLDHGATAPMCEAAKKAILEHIDDFGNPSSAHELGRQARVLIENARERIAKCINAEPEEIYFTSGGSEANSWALSKYISVSSNFEHHSVKARFRNIWIDNDGFVKTKFFSHINHPLAGYFDMGSCMMVNNEIGTIQPVKTIANIMHGKNMVFHTDAVQAVGHIPIDVKDLNCDMLSASAHKFGGSKGVGFLYIKNGTEVKRLVDGGKQEQGLRGGTENVLGIVSMAAALEDAVEHMEERNAHIKYLRDGMLDRLLQIPGSHLNGSLENRVSGNINIRFDDVSGARLVTLCSLYGVYISSGSACNEGISEPSHVLKAIGLTDEEALNSVRITIGHTNTEEEIDQAVNIITALVERIRKENE